MPSYEDDTLHRFNTGRRDIDNCTHSKAQELVAMLKEYEKHHWLDEYTRVCMILLLAG